MALAGCATIDVYHYEARPLPAGSQPLAVVSWTLQDLRNVSWSYGEPDPDPSRRAVLAATVQGVDRGAVRDELDRTRRSTSAMPRLPMASAWLPRSDGAWTVYLYDSHNRLDQLEFSSYAAARLFLDASTALAAQPPRAVDVASIKS